MSPLLNWARNVTYTPTEVLAPRSLPELGDALAGAQRAKVKGSGHSFNRVADTEGVLISLTDMPDDLGIDSTSRIVRVPGGLRYGDIVKRLDAAGLALSNLASLPHISVAGAVATGTHGSGDRVPPLSAAVAAVELMTADGEVRTLRRGEADFDGAVVSLGAMGVVVSLELDVVDRFEIAQTVYERVPVDAVLAELDAVTSLGYSVSTFTTWRDPDHFDQVWLKRRADDPVKAPATLLGASRATRSLHPLPGASAVACTPQLGVSGPWFERLPHFLLEFTPSSGEELQSEYFVERGRAVDALAALRALSASIVPLLQVSEIRTMAGDAQWLSPTRGQDTVAFHFTWIADQPRVEALLPVIEEALAPFQARPHWGKLFAARGEAVRAHYPRADRFIDLRDRLDPRGVFLNPYLHEIGLTHLAPA